MNKGALVGVFAVIAAMAIGHGASEFGDHPEQAVKREDACRNGVKAELPADDLAWLRLKACSNMPAVWLHKLVH